MTVYQPIAATAVSPTPAQSWWIVGGSVLGEGVFAERDVAVVDSRIGEIAPGGARRFDARGLLVVPGLIDIHGDAFERQVMPRPRVAFPLDMALLDTDAQVIASGITTVYHGVTWSWEPGLRGPDMARDLLDAIEALRPRLAADTRYHLRQETYNLDAEPIILEWLAAGRLGCVAFNDHMTGTFKARHRPEKIGKMVERSGLSTDAFTALVEAVYSRKDEVPDSIRRLALAAKAAGVPVLSHDDMSPEERAWHRSLGVTIAEFPITEETAAAAAEAGDAIVFGAPNVVRGGSHTGCPTAAEMVARGHCTVLASDYFYPALLAAPFRLARDGHATLARALDLVTRGPAEALGLKDRGRIATGLRADLAVIDPGPEGATPRVVATFAGGRLVHCTDASRL